MGSFASLRMTFRGWPRIRSHSAIVNHLAASHTGQNGLAFERCPQRSPYLSPFTPCANCRWYSAASKWPSEEAIRPFAPICQSS